MCTVCVVQAYPLRLQIVTYAKLVRDFIGHNLKFLPKYMFPSAFKNIAIDQIKRPCFSLPIHNKCYVITLHKLVVPVSSNIIIWSLHKIFNFSTQRYIGLSKHFHHNFKTSNASYIFEPHH